MAFCDLSGKVAIVTGASSGNGRGIALALGKAGATVVLAARRVEKLAEVANQIEGFGSRALAVATDVTDHKATDNLIAEAIKNFGKIDILVNNAGVLDYKNMIDITAEDLNKVMKVNFEGYLWTAQAAGREMIKAGSGSIVNIASVAAFFAGTPYGVYCISKAAVVMLTKSLALELGPKGIRANAIAPGIIETEMTQSTLADPKLIADFIAKIPLGRIGKPEDIAGVALFLSSELSSYVNGTVITADGGWTSHL